MKKIVMLTFLMLLIFTGNNVYAKTLNGIVLDKSAVVRQSASNSSKKLGTLKQGTSIKLTGMKGSYYILKASGKIGYIAKKSVAITYILVDISDQKLYFYNNGVKKWTASVVTGTKGVNDTPKGHYTLKKSNFKRKKTLMGNAKVEYWMPFITSRGIGFHDASWRKSFKKNTYLKNGSHGCVNMKTKDAKKLYANAPNSIDVIVR